MAQLRTKVRTPKTKKAEQPEVAVKEMTQPPRLVWEGEAPATYRSTKRLTPLRHNYAASGMTDKDHKTLREVVHHADKDRKLQRRNLDAGRVGRLYTMQFVDYQETGIYDPEQVITVLPKAYEYVKAVRAA